MKDKFVAKLMGIAKQHKKLRLPIVCFVTVILALYHAMSPVLLHIRKISVICFCVIVFMISSSFSFPVSGTYELAMMDSAGEKVVLESKNGPIELGTMNMSKYAATEEDVEALLEESEENQQVSLNEVVASKDPGTVEDGTIIYDEEKGYVDATFEDDWQLILINKANPIPDDYQFELGTIRGNIKSDIRVIEHVLDMIKAAKEDGVTLAICSPYRDYDRQVVLFNRKMKTYIRQGMSEEDAYELAAQTVAIPGTSEHQAGLAFDFISDDYKLLDAGFADCAAGKWLKTHSAEYGFILRYPKGKEDVTEIEFEPWHYRYVGETAAHQIMDQSITLEEYVKQIGLQ